MADAHPSTENRTVTAQGSLHSPGPWKLNWSYAGGGCLEGYPELQYVNIASHRYMQVAPNGLSLTGYVRPADAHLISAAPDLFDVVRDLVTYGGGMEYDDYRALVQRGEAAIAKAEGRS